MNLISTYIHHLDPVLIDFGHGIAIRWYGLAYLAGFVVGYCLLKYLSRRKLYPVPEEKLVDFITLTAIFGVLIGGRLGYVLFYMIPNEGLDYVLSKPWVIFQLWEGGMASHGGILGVLLFTMYYAWKHKTNWIALTDGLAIVAPVGLFFGRIANFINGELYGRVVSSGSAHGMKFPEELLKSPELRQKALNAIYTDCPPHILQDLQQTQSLPYSISDPSATSWIINRVRDTPEIREIVGSVLPERYPSQLYEAFAEGLLIFAILWLIRIRFPRAYTGVFCGLFSLLYAVGRIIVENFREPDSDYWYSMTRGQFLSIFLFLLAAGFLAYALKHRKSVSEDMPS